MNESIALTPETTIRRGDAILASALGEKTVMMDVEQGLYYGLDVVGSRVWALTEEQITVGGLCVRLRAEFEVSPEQCEREVSHFVREMLQREILQIVDEMQA